MYLARYVTAVRENLLLDSHTAESRDEAKAKQNVKENASPRGAVIAAVIGENLDVIWRLKSCPL